MPMKDPPRPGETVGWMIEELGVTVSAAASSLGVSRSALNNLIRNPKAAVSPEMAVRLEAVFGSTAGNWLRMQAGYDEAMIRKRKAEITKGLRRAAPRTGSAAAAG